MPGGQHLLTCSRPSGVAERTRETHTWPWPRPPENATWMLCSSRGFSRRWHSHTTSFLRYAHSAQQCLELISSFHYCGLQGKAELQTPPVLVSFFSGPSLRFSAIPHFTGSSNGKPGSTASTWLTNYLKLGNSLQGFHILPFV